MAHWHVSTQGTLAREHVSTQGTLARKHISMQGTLAHEHVSTQGTLGKGAHKACNLADSIWAEPLQCTMEKKYPRSSPRTLLLWNT